MQKGIKKGDVIIIISVILAACAVFCAMRLPIRDRGAVLVCSYGDKTESYELSSDTKFEISSLGYTVNVEIRDGKVTVESSDCPDRVCVNSGSITRSGECIVCVPAQLTLEIHGGEDADYDFIAG